MTYIEKNRANSPRKILYVIVGIIVFIYITLQIFWPNFIPALFTSMAVPFWRAEFSISSGSLSSNFSLLKENEELKRQLEEIKTKIDLADFLQSENEQLKSLLGGSTTSQSRILSAVLKRPPVAYYDELIIDVGLDKKVSTSSIVYASNNIPIGKIDEVLDSTSRVVLFSSPGIKNDVLIGNKNVSAVAVGHGGGKYEVELPRGVDVKVGDFVVGPSFHSAPLGRVISIDDSSFLPFEKMIFSTPVNIYELRWVFVDTKNK